MSVYEHPLATDFWLGAHDGFSRKPLLRPDTLAYGLAGGLIAELILGGFATLTTDPSTPEAELHLYLTAGSARPRDRALGPLVDMLAPGRPHVTPRPDAGRHHHLDSWPDEPFPPPAPTNARLPNLRTGQPITDVVRDLARSGRARQLTEDRLDPHMVVQESRGLLKKRIQKVPRNSVESGRPLSLIRSYLVSDPLYPRFGNEEDGRLSPHLQVLAALFHAAGVYRLPGKKLPPEAMQLLVEQLRTDLDPQIRELFRQVSIAITSVAITR
jgi:hypothetical protein